MSHASRGPGLDDRAQAVAFSRILGGRSTGQDIETGPGRLELRKTADQRLRELATEHGFEFRHRPWPRPKRPVRPASADRRRSWSTAATRSLAKKSRSASPAASTRPLRAPLHPRGSSSSGRCWPRHERRRSNRYRRAGCRPRGCGTRPDRRRARSRGRRLPAARDRRPGHGRSGRHGDRDDRGGRRADPAVVARGLPRRPGRVLGFWGLAHSEMPHRLAGSGPGAPTTLWGSSGRWVPAGWRVLSARSPASRWRSGSDSAVRSPRTSSCSGPTRRP